MFDKSHVECPVGSHVECLILDCEAIRSLIESHVGSYRSLEPYLMLDREQI